MGKNNEVTGAAHQASTNEVRLTEEGKNRYEKELEILRTVRRPKVSERIRTAREFGDISENAEYESAKQEQAFVEGRITELEKLLKNAIIIKSNEITNDMVGFETIVTLRDLTLNEDMRFSIVPTRETDPRHGKISNECPVGKAIMGHHVGDEVTVRTEDGPSTWKILSIEINKKEEQE
ncbi:transcription elongation factor GreA [bacterium]|nr:transcription elongation factor GreA [bacterium]